MSFHYRDKILMAEYVSLPALAERYETPLYVYSDTLLRHNYRHLKECFEAAMPGQDYLVAYACKANSTLGILCVLADEGAGSDIVSGGELERSLAAGIPPGKIVFSGVGKTQTEIEAAIDKNIAHINIESAAEMDLIATLAEKKNKTVPVSFRLNPDVDAETHAKINTGKKETKFALPATVIRDLYDKATRHTYLDPCGLSVHIGSQLTKLSPFESAFRKLASFVKDLRREGFRINTLDLGGGIGIMYEQENLFDLKDYIALIRDWIAPLETKIILEPGRALTGNTGLLLSRVLYSKQAGHINYLIIDAATTDFMRPLLYDAVHPIWPVYIDHDGQENSRSQASADITALKSSKNVQGRQKYDIAGPVCETGDILARNISLPSTIETPGSLIAFMLTGAYGACMASMYNARPLPAEIIVKSEKISELRPRISVQDIMTREKIPAWLET